MSKLTGGAYHPPGQPPHSNARGDNAPVVQPKQQTSQREPGLYLRDPDVELHLGDALEVLRGLPDESVHCVATSPPFFGLRDYGTGRWEGGDEGCDHTKREGQRQDVGRVQVDGFHGSAKDSTLKTRYYEHTCGKCGARRIDQQIGLEASPDEWAARLVEVFREARRVLRQDGSAFIEVGDSYLNKDLVLQPFLLAFALKADGWILRGAYVWARPNCMPESAKDRCTVSHSHVLHLSKSRSYFFDGDAISEPAAWERWGDQTVPKHEGTETAAGWIKPKSKQELTGESRPPGRGDTYSGFNQRWKERLANGDGPRTKNPRSVWTIPTQGFPEAHFATWPEALARRIILAAVPAMIHNGCGDDPDLCGPPTCFPGTVLDPFAGSGTTAYVARKLGRRAIGIDLNESYLEMASRRLQQQSLFADANG